MCPRCTCNIPMDLKRSNACFNRRCRLKKPPPPQSPGPNTIRPFATAAATVSPDCISVSASSSASSDRKEDGDELCLMECEEIYDHMRDNVDSKQSGYCKMPHHFATYLACRVRSNQGGELRIIRSSNSKRMCNVSEDVQTQSKEFLKKLGIDRGRN
jgi:hypothetical protein